MLLHSRTVFFEDPLDAAAIPIAMPASTTSPPTIMAPVGTEPSTGSSATPPDWTVATVSASAGAVASPSVGAVETQEPDISEYPSAHTQTESR